MARPWTDAEVDVLRAGFAAGHSKEEIAKHLGRSVSSVRQKGVDVCGRWDLRDVPADGPAPLPPIEPPAPTGAVRKEFSGDSVHLDIDGTPYSDPEELMRLHGFDPDVWEIERAIVNHYPLGSVTRKVEKDEHGGKVETATPEVTMMFQVKLWLKRSRQASVLKEIGDRILANIEAARPAWTDLPAVVLPHQKDRYLWEVCMMDLHVGKLSWAAETGVDYDVSLAEEAFRDALEDLVRQVQGRAIEQILFPIGNDLLQVDNLQKTTTGGTPQDTDTRFVKMFVRAEALMQYALERLSGIAPVTGVVVPGNHDRQTAFTLGRVLYGIFRGNPRVTIDCGPKLRKYHRYGVNLIGYTHGSEEKPADLPLIMAQECPEAWSQTRFREWHTGHYHKAKETRYTAGDSFNGVRVRIIPALCAADAWHMMKGYVGEIRSAEAYLWSHSRGYAGHQASNVLDEIPAAA